MPGMGGVERGKVVLVLIVSSNPCASPGLVRCSSFEISSLLRLRLGAELFDFFGGFDTGAWSLLRFLLALGADTFSFRACFAFVGFFACGEVEMAALASPDVSVVDGRLTGVKPWIKGASCADGSSMVPAALISSIYQLHFLASPIFQDSHCY